MLNQIQTKRNVFVLIIRSGLLTIENTLLEIFGISKEDV